MLGSLDELTVHANKVSKPEDLVSFLHWSTHIDAQADCAVCAFGKDEIRCLQAAFKVGRKARVGFENHSGFDDGSLASDIVERVAETRRAIDEMPT